MFYFYLLECWRLWSRQRLTFISVYHFADVKGTDQTTDEWCDAVILYILTGILMPTWLVKLTKHCPVLMRSWFVAYSRAFFGFTRHSCQMAHLFSFLLYLFHHFAQSYSMNVHCLRFLFDIVCVRCNLFNLMHNLFVFIVMFNLNWCMFDAQFLSLSLSFWHWHKMFCHNKIAMNIFILFGISTTTQTTM